MPLEHTLNQVNTAIEQGQLSKAKDRLHGLLNSYPNSLEIRDKLGELYWQMEEPETAGRYWFLIEAHTPEMVAANYQFASACDNDPLEILRRIEFKGNIADLDQEFAKFMLMNLARESKERYGTEIDLNRNQQELDSMMSPLVYEKQPPLRHFLNWTGCILAMIIPVVLFVVAAFAIVRWLF